MLCKILSKILYIIFYENLDIWICLIRLLLNCETKQTKYNIDSLVI